MDLPFGVAILPSLASIVTLTPRSLEATSPAELHLPTHSFPLSCLLDMICHWVFMAFLSVPVSPVKFHCWDPKLKGASLPVQVAVSGHGYRDSTCQNRKVDSWDRCICFQGSCYLITQGDFLLFRNLLLRDSFIYLNELDRSESAPSPTCQSSPICSKRECVGRSQAAGMSLLEGDSTDTRKGQVSPGVNIYTVLNMVLLWDKRKPLDH